MNGLDALIERIVLESPPGEIAEARAHFASRTGAFEPGEPFFEERLRAAFDEAVTTWGTPRGSLLRRFLAAHPEAPASLLRTWRSVFLVVAVEEAVRVRGLLGGAELCIVKDDGAASRLREGDLFDGRVFVEDGVRLMPGAIFFDRDAHQAIFALTEEAARHHKSSEALGDALLRMQMRLLRQPSLRVHHVYRWDAFERTEILAAPWARPRR